MKRTRMLRVTQARIHAEKLAKLFSLAIGSWVYRDTIRVRFSDRLSKTELEDLRQANGKGEVFCARELFGQWANGVIIQRPSREVIACLASMRLLHLLVRADLSWDLDVPDDLTRIAAAKGLVRQVRMLWHGKRTIRIFKDTIYYARAGQGRYLVIYFHRASKVSRIPTIHIELRFTSPDACRRNGLGNLHDLLICQILTVFKDNIKFSFIDRNAFNRNLEIAAGEKVRKANSGPRGYRVDRLGWMRRMLYRLGRDLVGDEYDSRCPLFDQLLVQSGIDAKSPLFKHAIQTIPVDWPWSQVSQAWPRCRPYNNKDLYLSDWHIDS